MAPRSQSGYSPWNSASRAISTFSVPTKIPPNQSPPESVAVVEPPLWKLKVTSNDPPPLLIWYSKSARDEASSWIGGLTTVVDSVAGALVGAALPTSVILLYRWLRGIDGMGWGDVKYLAAIGAVVGLHGCLMVLVVAAILGALVGGFLIAIGRGSGKTALPFGTFLAVAVILWLYLPSSWRLMLPL